MSPFHMGDFLILILLGILVFLAARYIIRHKGAGCSGGSCTGCPHAGNCHSDKKDA